MPIEVRANDKHETLLCRVDEEGILLYNKNTRQEEKLCWKEIKAILEKEWADNANSIRSRKNKKIC